MRIQAPVAVLFLIVSGCATSPKPAASRAPAPPERAALERAAVAADPILRKPAFTASPQELLGVAKGQQSPSGVVILTSERHHVFDSAGVSSMKSRLLYVITGQAGMESWNDIGASWSPWHEQRPVLKARVISPQGRVFELDPQTVEEGGGRAAGDAIYSDVRRLRAPLPGLSIGAVVEQEVVFQETSPLYEAGVVSQFYFYNSNPTLRTRLVVEHPQGAQVTFSERGPGVPTPTRSVQGETQRVVYESAAWLPPEDFDEGLPSDVLPVALVGYTTGTSWNQLAARYHAQTRARLEGADVSSMVKHARNISNREARIASLIARLHEEVRYTGLEFGESALVPNRPSEVVQRRYGDCKDKSLLLVAMLDAVGIKAHLALLNAGSSIDVDPKLPGMGKFDHAIVQIPGTPTYWVDATAEHTALGDLPLSVQGRQALVISDKTQGLTPTTSLPSEHNRTVEERVYTLAEDKPVRLLETTTTSGAESSSLRASYHGADPKKLKEILASYTQSIYGTEQLQNYRHSDIKKVSEPFELELQIDEPSAASVSEEDAAVTINVMNLFTHVPAWMRTWPATDAKKDKATAADKRRAQREAARTVDFELPRAYVYEINTTIVPPAGFIADRFPEKQTWKMALAQATQQSEVLPSGAVKVSIKFDSGPRRMTADQLRAFRVGLKEFFDSDAVRVTFLQEGEAHLGAGRVREALASFRKLIKEHPENPRHHARLARGLLAAGLGQAARRTIDDSLVGFEKSPALQLAKGWIYEHNLIGQRFANGFDQAVAAAAYRAGAKLDDTDNTLKASLAILLERNEEGDHSYPANFLQEAYELYKTLYERKMQSMDVNYLLVLLKMHKWKDIIELDNKMQPTTVGFALRLAAMAQTKGVAAALKESTRSPLNVADTAEATRMAGAELMHLREYNKASQLLEAGARNHANASNIRQLASQLGQLRKHEDNKPSDTISADVGRRFTIASLSVAGGADASAFDGLMGGPLAQSLQSDLRAGNKSFLEGLRASTKAALIEMPLDVMKDFSALVPVQIDGNDAVGYRVVMSSSTGSAHIFAQRVGKRYVSTALGEMPHTMGEVVREFLRKGDAKAARQWLDWAFAESRTPGPDPLLTPPLRHVWTPGFPASEETMRTAVAVLTAAVNPKELAVLEACIARPVSEAARLGCEMVLHAALMSEKRHQDAAKLSKGWVQRFPDSVVALDAHVSDLLLAENVKAAEAWLVKNVGSHANAPQVFRMRASLADKQGDLRATVAFLKKVVTSGQAASHDHNNLAWMTWAEGTKVAEAEQLAAEAVRRDNRGSYASLHTWATILADRGKPEEALRLLHEANAKRRGPNPDADWLVVGLIAEAYGMPDLAAESYAMVKPEKDDSTSSSSHAISQRRLAALNAKRQGKAFPTAEPMAATGAKR